MEGALLVFLLPPCSADGRPAAVCDRALELREGQAAADPVLHVLDLPLVGHHEDQVVPELPQSLVGPLVLEDLLDERREPLGVGIDGERIVMEHDQVGPAIPHGIVDLVGAGREGLQG